MSTGYLEKASDIANRVTYVDKPAPWSSHTRITSWLSGFAPGTRVLDIGAATGMIGRLCTEMRLRMTGIIHPFFVASAVGRFLDHCLSGLTSVFPTLPGYQFVV